MLPDNNMFLAGIWNLVSDLQGLWRLCFISILYDEVTILSDQFFKNNETKVFEHRWTFELLKLN